VEEIKDVYAFSCRELLFYNFLCISHNNLRAIISAQSSADLKTLLLNLEEQ